MNYRQVETSREIRLWVTGILMPLAIGATTILASNPELLEDVKTSIGRKVKSFKGTKKEETL